MSQERRQGQTLDVYFWELFILEKYKPFQGSWS